MSNVKVIFVNGKPEQIDMGLVMQKLREKKEVEKPKEEVIAVVPAPRKTLFEELIDQYLGVLSVSTFPQGQDDFEEEYPSVFEPLPADKGLDAQKENWDPCVDECELTNCIGCLFNECNCPECIKLRNGMRAYEKPFVKSEKPAVAEKVEVPVEALKEFYVSFSIELIADDSGDNYGKSEVDDLLDDLLEMIELTEDQEESLYYDEELSAEGFTDNPLSQKELVELVSRHKAIIKKFDITIDEVVRKPYSNFKFEVRSQP